MILSALITGVPFFIAAKGIEQTKKVYLWYAVGAGIGTALGMIV
jgi:hypothetical protein